MNKFKFYFIVITASVLFFSCSKDDNEVTIAPPVAFEVQYPLDIAIIKDYLTTHYITVINHPGFVDDQDVTITKIDKGQPSIMSYLNSTTYPKLLIRPVKLHNVDYELYYLVLREGKKDLVTGYGGVSPCNVDGVLASYKGTYLSRSAATATPALELTATFFEELKYPQAPESLFTVITGWSEIFPLFKTGTSDINADGTVTHKDFGAGVMFIPSGLAYYNTGKGSIPAYAPLVFSFKLYNIERLDQDNDGIPSYQEDFNTLVGDGIKDGYMRILATGVANPDDTDGDGIPDFLDVDDDGDNYTTKLEITKPTGTNSGLSLYFPYDPIVDNPLTTVIETESKGIPSYDATKVEKFDYTTPNRLRIHLDNKYPLKKP